MESNVSQSNPFFDNVPAKIYDDNNSKFKAIADNLHFLIKLVLEKLPTDASILCVGVGTGVEISSLAKAFPHWRFSGIDPSASMLEGARERAKTEGFADRSEFFHGYLNQFQSTQKYDAVLCLYVMHFVKEGRLEMFQDMASRLKPGGYLVDSEISADFDAPEFPGLLEGWKSMHRLGGAPEDKLATMQDTLKNILAVLPPQATEQMMRQSGLSTPVPFFQSLLIRGWYARKQ